MCRHKGLLHSCVLLCPVSSPGAVAHRLRRPGHAAGRAVAEQPEKSGQSQRGGDERSRSPVLPGRPGHLAPSAHRLPRHAVQQWRDTRQSHINESQEPHKNNYLPDFYSLSFKQ